MELQKYRFQCAVWDWVRLDEVVAETNKTLISLGKQTINPRYFLSMFRDGTMNLGEEIVWTGDGRSLNHSLAGEIPLDSIVYIKHDSARRAIQVILSGVV